MISVRRTLTVLAAALLAGAVTTTVAEAATVSGVACVTPGTAHIRYLPAGSACDVGEIQVDLGHTAPAVPGPPGPPGPEGPAGPPGPAGAGLTGPDDLDGKPCDVASGDPGTTAVSYGYGQGLQVPAVLIYCQKGPITLTVSLGSSFGRATGSVHIDPPGTVCSVVPPPDATSGYFTHCDLEYAAPTTVTITAVPGDADTSFGGFGNLGPSCRNGGPCTVRVDHSMSIYGGFAVVGPSVSDPSPDDPQPDVVSAPAGP
jgi:hypothetical protein